MKKKGLLTALLATGLILATAFTSFAGWENNKDGDYTVTVYRDDNTEQLITGWRELPWKDTTAWFYFDNNNILYQMRETPDGYIVDSDGAWYDGVKPFNFYNWSSLRESTNETSGNKFTSIEMHFVSDFFFDFTGEMTPNEFKEYMTNKGAEVLTCSQTNRKGTPYMLEAGGNVFYPVSYFTDFTFNYKGLKFDIGVQTFTDKIGTGAQISVVGKVVGN